MAVALVRRSWRQLTSMRTALMLLFLLAIAAVPGSVLPQRNVAQEKVTTYLRDHPRSGPLLDRFGFFSVYASPWFSAIYLLLFLSLVGCLVPRFRSHLTALLRVPPDAPTRLNRLPAHAEGLAHDGDRGQTAQRLQKVLQDRRFRVVVREHPDGTTVSGEKGYLKETGNLLFHFALLTVLIGVAFGSWYGWHGNRILVAGNDRPFCDTLLQYDEHGLGARVGDDDLPPFCLTLNQFQVSYLDSGQPVSFKADVTVRDNGTDSARTFSVNDPLRLKQANVYLLGHGYAPVIKYTDKYGRSQTTVPAFLDDDAMLTSDGVATFPDVNINPATGQRDDRSQVGFQGTYIPTLADNTTTPTSVYPGERNPRLFLQPYKGELGFDAGKPLSVYDLDVRQINAGRLVKFGPQLALKPGDVKTLPDGSTVQFLGTRPWVSLSVRYDPGEKLVLVGAVALLVGLLGSLTGKRRRIFFRVTDTAVEAGGLPRSDYPGFTAEFDEVVRSVGDAAPSAPAERVSVPDREEH
jgi:cytochrome c biogenesis protein